MKFVPLRFFVWIRIVALINAEQLSPSVILRLTALDVRQLKSTAHLFESASVFLRVTMFYGPNTSTPTVVNGGDETTLSDCRSAMIC